MSIHWPEVLSTALVLFFILDPLGNIPLFHNLVCSYPIRRRMRILFREMLIGLGIMALFLHTGNQLLGVLGLSQSSLNISGGVILFIIALRMVFPGRHDGKMEQLHEEPFIVPIAVPMIAGPSAIAILLLQGSRAPEQMLDWSLALFLAWLPATLIIVSSPVFLHYLGQRTLRAIERLMGMILIMMAIQMLLNGIKSYIQSIALSVT